MDHSKRHLLRGLCVSTLSGSVVQARLFVCSVVADSADSEPHELNRISGKVITTYPGGSLAALHSSLKMKIPHRTQSLYFLEN